MRETIGSVQVSGGRIRIDEDTSLPNGTRVDLVVDLDLMEPSPTAVATAQPRRTSDPAQFVIPLTWECTSAPTAPVSFPIAAKARIGIEGINLLAERVGSIAGDERANVFIDRDEILGVEIVVHEDLPDDADTYTQSISDYSRLILSRRDRNQVVDAFRETFSFDKAYWALAFSKALKSAGIAVQCEDRRVSRPES